MPPRIPWSNTLVVCLLDCIIEKGAHLVTGTKLVKDTWNEVNELFFSQPETVHLKDLHYEEGKPRKLRDKYISVKKEAEKELANKDSEANTLVSGAVNLSGKIGHLGKIYQRMQLILQQIEDTNGKDYDDVDRLNQTVSDSFRLEPSPLILNRKHKHSDILITENSHNSKLYESKRLKLDEKTDVSSVLKYLISKENVIPMLERETEIRMNEYYQHKTIADLIIDGNLSVHDDAIGVLESIGLHLIINIYCSPGDKFNAASFKKSLIELGLPPLPTHQLYVLMESWRRKLPSLGMDSESDSVEESSMSRSPSRRRLNGDPRIMMDDNSSSQNHSDT